MNALLLTFCHKSQELRRTVSYFKFLCHNLSFRIVVLAVTYRCCLIVNILNILPHIAKKINFTFPKIRRMFEIKLHTCWNYGKGNKI